MRCMLLYGTELFPKLLEIEKISDRLYCFVPVALTKSKCVFINNKLYCLYKVTSSAVNFIA